MLHRPRLSIGFLLVALASSSPVRGQGAPDISWARGGHRGGVASIALSPDGTVVASASPGDNTIKLWHASDGSLIRTIGAAYSQLHCIAFAPDGQSIYAGADWLPGLDDAPLKRWSITDGALLQSFNSGVNYSVAALAVSPDGSKVAIGCSDFKARIYSASTGALQSTLTGHTGNVMAVAFSPDGQVVATGAADNKAKTWSASTGALLHTLTGHTFFVDAVEFAPDGLTIATGSWDNSVRIWNAASGASIKTLHSPAGSSVYAVAFSPDGTKVASAGGENSGPAVVRIWDIASGSVVKTLAGHASATWDLLYKPDGGTLVSCGADDVSRFWNPSSGAMTLQLGLHRGGVNDVEFSPDGTIFAAADDIDPSETGGDIELLDAADGHTLRTCAGHMDVINAVGFSPDGSMIVSAAGSPPPDTTDPTVRLWRVSDAAQLRVLAGHTGGSTVAAFSADGSLVASGGRDQKVRIWNASTGNLVTTLSGHTGAITGLQFTSDGALLVSADDTGKIKLWQLPGFSLADTITNDWGVSSMRLSDDDQYLVAGLNAYGDNVIVRRLSDGALLHTFAGDSDGFVQSVDFAPGGAQVISGSGYSFRIQVWDVAAETLAASFDKETGWGPNPRLPVAYAPGAAGTFGYGRGDATIVSAHLAPQCAAADITCDGHIDIDDLFAVINAWGPCPAGPCAADVDGSGTVDVDDLFAVINNWT